MTTIHRAQSASEAATYADSGASEVPLAPDAETEHLGDGLAVMLFLMERSAQNSMAAAELRIGDTRKAIQAQLDEFLERIADAARAAEKAKKDDGGWFSNFVGDIVDIVGEVLGPVVELGVEMAKYQVDVVVDVVDSIRNDANLLSNLTQTTLALGQSGEISADVRGFADGAARFLTDLTEFVAKAQLVLARAAVTGDSAAEMLEADADTLRQSLERNIVDNPHFMKVVSVATKAASLVAVAATAGAASPLAIAAVAILATLEVDKRTGVLDAVFKDAAPHIRIALQGAAVACSAFAGGAGNQLVDAVRKVTLVLDAARDVYGAARVLVEGHREADELDAEAEQLATLHTMHRLQRLLEQLIDSFEEDAETHTDNRELGSQVVQTRADAEAAAIIPA